jgi:hypothetical protein
VIQIEKCDRLRSFLFNIQCSYNKLTLILFIWINILWIYCYSICFLFQSKKFKSQQIFVTIFWWSVKSVTRTRTVIGTLYIKEKTSKSVAFFYLNHIFFLQNLRVISPWPRYAEIFQKECKYSTIFIFFYFT